MKNYLFLVLIGLAAGGIWADDHGVVEPAGKNDALVILSMRFPQLLAMDPGPNAVYLQTLDPWISDSYIMGKDGDLFYMGNLQVGRTYRISNFVVQFGNTTTTYVMGWQGDDGFSFTVDQPGILYLGDFAFTEKERMHLVGKTQERTLLKKLSANLAFRPTWKALVEKRIKELN